MTIPCYVNEHISEIRAIKPGWYGMESNGKLSSGPFSNQGECLTGITEASSHFRASPWLEAIKCPECRGEHVRAVHALRWIWPGMDGQLLRDLRTQTQPRRDRPPHCPLSREPYA